jgi:hypothetical protein
LRFRRFCWLTRESTRRVRTRTVQFIPKALGTTLVIAVVLGVSESVRYDVEGGFPVIDVLGKQYPRLSWQLWISRDEPIWCRSSVRERNLFQQPPRRGIVTNERGVPESFSCPVDHSR